MVTVEQLSKESDLLLNDDIQLEVVERLNEISSTFFQVLITRNQRK